MKTVVLTCELLFDILCADARSLPPSLLLCELFHAMLTGEIVGRGLAGTEREQGTLPLEHVMVWAEKAIDSGGEECPSRGFLSGKKSVHGWPAQTQSQRVSA